MCGEELADEGAVEVAGLLKGLVVDLVVSLWGHVLGLAGRGCGCGG